MSESRLFMFFVVVHVARTVLHVYLEQVIPESVPRGTVLVEAV